MQVAAPRTLICSVVATVALNYFAAFNLVGWNFLLPGRYTFGLVSVACIVLITLWMLIWLCQLEWASALVAAIGSVSATLLVSLLIWGGLLDLKDYFIWGLPFGMAMATASILSLFRLGPLLAQLRMEAGISRVSLVLGCIALLAIISWAVRAAPDVQHYLRQQAYVMTAGVLASAALLFVAQRLASAMRKKT